jgi:hypothetical protein
VQPVAADFSLAADFVPQQDFETTSFFASFFLSSLLPSVIADAEMPKVMARMNTKINF